MPQGRESHRRDRLKRLSDELISISEDSDLSVTHVIDLTHAPSCKECGDYADDVVMEIKVVYKR